MLYTYSLARKQLNPLYKELSDIDKYYLEQYEYYFHWWEELNRTKNFVSRMDNFYKLNHIKQNKNTFKNIDLNSISIREVISMYTKIPDNLRRNIKCILNDHNDKTSSFKIYENTNSRYCFWCKKWWNVVNFLSDIEGISNRKAFKRICNLFW